MKAIIYEWSKSKAMLEFGCMEQHVLMIPRQHFEAIQMGVVHVFFFNYPNSPLCHLSQLHFPS